MKNLIHYPQLRAFVDVSTKLAQKNNSSTWTQKVFSNSFLKNTKLEHILSPIAMFFFPAALGPVAFMGHTLFGTIGVFTALVLTGSIFVFLTYLASRWLLCSDARKKEITQKLQKIVALHPKTEEIIAPVLLLLKNDISLEIAEQLEIASNDILLNMEDERTAPHTTIAVQTEEHSIENQHKNLSQRFIL